MIARPCAVYRCFSEQGELLYVGCSWSPMVRAFDHCKLKPWAVIMSRIEVEWFDCRSKAREAEITAIKKERPTWNCHHSDNPKHAIGVYHPDFDRNDPASWAAKPIAQTGEAA